MRTLELIAGATLVAVPFFALVSAAVGNTTFSALVAGAWLIASIAGGVRLLFYGVGSGGRS